MTSINVFSIGRPSSVVWSIGFRPFFLLASLWAAISVSAWAAMQWGVLPRPPFEYANVWHGHEMVFGFGSAGIIGFLYTAVANWTGARTPYGPALQVLVGCWVLGRVAPFLPNTFGLVLGGVANLLFWTLATWQLGRRLWAPNLRHNRWFVLYFALMGLASAGVYYCTWVQNLEWARRGNFFGIDVILMIISHLGGRVIPMFTSRAVPNSKVKANPVLEKIFPWVFLVQGILHLLLANHLVAALASAVVAVLWGVRWFNWDPLASRKVPILWVLHSACFWMLGAFVLRAFWTVWPEFPEGVWIHSFTVGTIGILIYGMMTRVALGHTGRAIGQPPQGVVFGYYLLNLAALIRVGLPIVNPAWNNLAVLGAAILWSLAFGLYALIYGPWLLTPSPDGRVA